MECSGLNDPQGSSCSVVSGKKMMQALNLNHSYSKVGKSQAWPSIVVSTEEKFVQ